MGYGHALNILAVTTRNCLEDRGYEKAGGTVNELIQGPPLPDLKAEVDSVVSELHRKLVESRQEAAAEELASIFGGINELYKREVEEDISIST